MKNICLYLDRDMPSIKYLNDLLQNTFNFIHYDIFYFDLQLKKKDFSMIIKKQIKEKVKTK